MVELENTSVQVVSAVPLGHVLVDEKWRGSELVQKLQGKIRVLFEDGLGLVDFHLSNRCCVIYISEADLVVGSSYKRKLVRFRNASNLRGIVVVEKTRMSEQYFPSVQKFVLLELGMALIPVADQGEASQLIIQLVHEESKERDHNPFLRRNRLHLAEPSVLNTIQQIPGVGKIKALSLLQEFPSIHHLGNATTEELSAVVGHTVAQQIRAFFS
ncbi:Fanconi anemia core complex-associated protein 24 [Protopterus annectens]|uniref:Fanconi anemia core complex-associated protein 24 n=1 Tax=Protopterus annectens TaxID=7888 RepID=UPI001CFB4571|nr:Fanconi anemia core complex-associated protein 24 [Protopterus annectens]